MINLLDRFQNYLANAGLREWGIMGIWVIAALLIFAIFSLFADKWEGDFRHWMLIALFTFIVFLGAFLLFWWLELRQWEPVLSIFSK